MRKVPWEVRPQTCAGVELAPGTPALEFAFRMIPTGLRLGENERRLAAGSVAHWGPNNDWSAQIATLETMLHDRSYTNLKAHWHGEDPMLLCTCKDAKGELTFVFLSFEVKVGVRTLRKIRQEGKAAGSRHLILLSQDGMTPFAAREMGDAQDVDLEIFRKAELCMPITHHHLVPKHIPLSKAEKATLLAQLGCKASALPKLKESDPVARYMHFMPGTVIKILRTIGSLEGEPYFRVVV